MLLFTGDETGRVVIPLARVYDIETNKNKITITYNSGEMDLSIVDCPPVPQRGIVTLKFDTEDGVDKIMRQFFKACNNGVNAFYFGK